jgi:peptide/nickel transport system ATP-binding protein
VSYIFITHNLGIVQHVCDEIAVMRAGKIVEYGPCEAVLNDPQAPYTMELLASIPRPGWHPGKTATLLEFGAGNM